MEWNPLRRLARALQREADESHQKAAPTGLIAYMPYQGRVGVEWPHDAKAYAEVMGGAYPWVFACVDLIASSLARVPLRLYRKTPKGPEAVEGGPLPLLLDTPSPATGWNDLCKLVSVDLSIQGNAFWYVVRSTSSRAPVSELWRLPPEHMKVIPSPAGPTAYVLEQDTKRTRYEPEEIIHFRQPNPHNAWYGLSDLASAALAAEVDKRTAEANLDMATKGFRPDLLLTLGPGYEEQLQDPQKARAFQSEAEKSYQGKSHGVHLMLPGSKAEPYGTAPRDMEFEALRRMSREEICGVFGVPPCLVGILDKATYSNFETATAWFWDVTLRNRAVKVADTLNQYLVSQYRAAYGGVVFVEFDLSTIDALQDKALDERRNDREEYGLSLISREEYRAKWHEELPSVPVGQTVLPISLIPEGEMGLPPAEAPPLPPAKSWLQQLGLPALPEGEAVPFPTGVKGDLIWKAWDRRLSRYEGPIRKAATRLIRREAQHVRGRLGKKATPDANADAESLLWDQAVETQVWWETLGPLERYVIETEGQTALDSIGIDQSFDLANPRAQELLRQREVVIKTIPKTRWQELRDSLAQGIEAGETEAELTQRVQTFEDMVDWKAENIARTEAGSSANAGHLEGLTQGGADYKKWIATRDGRTRDSHRHLDGTVIPIGEDFHGENGSGPGPGQMGSAAEDCGCRCTVVVGREAEVAG